jgi:N-acetylneuraminate synthase
MNIFNKYPFLIAGIGDDFQVIAEKEGISDVDAIKYVIDEARDCGINAVKLQPYKSQNHFLDQSAISSSFTIDEYREIAEYCRNIGMKFLLTPLDLKSVDDFDDFLDIFCISSADLTNIPFIEYVASKNKPILLFTGASTIREIRQAIDAIENVSMVDIAIFHVVLSYPVDYNDANLLMINDLAENFPDYEIGYCDNTVPDDNMAVLTTAYNYGATILEKLFTIDKSLTDCEYAMDADDVIKFNWNVNFISKVNGMKNKQPVICESSAIREMRKLSESKK